MTKTFMITVLALVASVAAEPYVYGISRPYVAPTSAAYNALAVPSAYTAFPGGYAGYAGYAGYPGYTGVPLPYSLSALSPYDSSYGVEELVQAPLVNAAAPAPLVYGNYPYAAPASYVYTR